MWKYTGSDAGWYPGIPTRNLTDDEVKELGVADLLKASAHYEHVSDAEHPRLAAQAEKLANPATGGGE